MKKDLPSKVATCYLLVASASIIILLLKAFSSLDELEKMLSVLKDLANTIFFLAIPCIGWLTFKQAYYTIFNTQKNEVFKIQLKEYEEILKLLYTPDLDRMITKFYLDKIIWDNSKRLENAFDVIEKSLSITDYVEKESKCKNILIVLGGDDSEIKMPLEINGKNFEAVSQSNFELYGLEISDEATEFFKKLEELRELSFIDERFIIAIDEIKNGYYDVRWKLHRQLMQIYKLTLKSDDTMSKHWFHYKCLNQIRISEEVKELYRKVKNLCDSIRNEIDIKNVMK